MNWIHLAVKKEKPFTIRLLFLILWGHLAVGLPDRAASTFMDELRAQEEAARASGKYTYLNPKKEKTIPHEFVVQTLLRGSAFRMEKREFTDSIRILRIKRKECQPSKGIWAGWCRLATGRLRTAWI